VAAGDEAAACPTEMGINVERADASTPGLNHNAAKYLYLRQNLRGCNIGISTK